MWRTSLGRPRSDIRIVTWCRLSGDSDQKSHIAVGLRLFGPRITLLRADETRELVSVTDEEDRRVVANHVPVALLGVDLEREAAHVALGIRRPRSPATV